MKSFSGNQCSHLGMGGVIGAEAKRRDAKIEYLSVITTYGGDIDTRVIWLASLPTRIRLGLRDCVLHSGTIAALCYNLTLLSSELIDHRNEQR